jgi:hypothetical protein
MEKVVARYMPGHDTCSPLATVTFMVPWGSSWSEVRDAASSETKLCVELESMSMRREAPPS